MVTYRRPHLLARALESIERAARFAPALKISTYVLVNGKDQESTAVLSRSSASPFAFSTSERVSPAHARNLLLRSVCEDWVLFLDDDAYLPEDGFSRFLEIRDRWPLASAIGGPNLTPPTAPPLEQAMGRALASRWATWFSVSRYRQQGSERVCGEESLMLCNLFVRRADLDVDPFPAHFVCAEENWLLQTLAREGKLMVHAPSLSAFHDRRAGWWAQASQVFRYGFGRGQNLRLRPETTRVAHLIPSACVLSAPVLLALGQLQPFIVYAGLCAVGAWRVGSWRSVPVFMLIHAFYGFGVIAGWVSRCEPGECVQRREQWVAEIASR